jgi:hypothetical protein
MESPGRLNMSSIPGAIAGLEENTKEKTSPQVVTHGLVWRYTRFFRENAYRPQTGTRTVIW